MSKSSVACCVVVADGARARFFFAAAPSRNRPGSRPTLEERADLTNAGQQHPGASGTVSGVDRHRASAGGAGRNDDTSAINHKREHDRQFAAEIAQKLAECCEEWEVPNVVLVADKHTLGQLRQTTDHLTGVMIREFPKDLSKLEPPQIQTHLTTAGLMPGSHPGAHAAH
jgi:protein required for attachment to host cells